MSEGMKSTLAEITARIEERREEIRRLEELAVHLQAVLGPADVEPRKTGKRKVEPMVELPPPTASMKPRKKVKAAVVDGEPRRRGRPRKVVAAAPETPARPIPPPSRALNATPALSKVAGKPVSAALAQAREEVEAIKDEINAASANGKSTRELEDKLEAALLRMEAIREGVKK